MTAQELLHVRAGKISSSCRIKKYPDGSLELLACSNEVFRPDGWENAKERPRVMKKKSPSGDETENLDRAMRRARAQVKDLALCTPFRYFVTLTLDQARVDRYDMAEITKKLNRWLDNQVRRKGLAYVLVPERHKDGAIHFHGFFNDALEVKDSGHKDRKGHTVYNLPAWTLGFTTAIELYGDYRAAVGYVCKYIGKQGEKPGGRWYYSGGNLGHPEVSYADISYRELAELDGAYTFEPEGSGLAFAMVRVEPQQEERMDENGNRQTQRGRQPVGHEVEGHGGSTATKVRFPPVPGPGMPGLRGGGANAPGVRGAGGPPASATA